MYTAIDLSQPQRLVRICFQNVNDCSSRYFDAKRLVVLVKVFTHFEMSTEFQA